ncbi:hypothetical protein GCM10018790_61720 [Kitasatospora xanthocidica]|nr:hypothetical protein [Kitasatospora xanthocidica]GHF75501.1 hypothetical protein GCM10018790_61720 [Kitasatospora xanthocidica]
MTRQPAPTLRSRYVEQVASDLEENHRRQQELENALKVLKQEESLLVELLSLAERYEGFADPSRLPEQTQEEPVPATARPVARTAKAGAKENSRRPLLSDLLVELLGRHAEPCPAKDLREELMAKHPKRDPTPQVVRNTLESLVAKGRVRRHKQERSVLYTLVGTDPAG